MANINGIDTIIDQFIADSRQLHENGESLQKVAELLGEEKYRILLIIPDGTPASKKLFEAFKLWD